MAPAAPKQQDLGAPQKQLLPQLLASDMAGLSFGAKLAAAWSGQLQASALQGLHDQVQPLEHKLLTYSKLAVVQSCSACDLTQRCSLLVTPPSSL